MDSSIFSNTREEMKEEYKKQNEGDDTPLRMNDMVNEFMHAANTELDIDEDNSQEGISDNEISPETNRFRNDEHKNLKKKKSLNFIDFEKDLYESDNSEEWKDKVDNLPQSNIFSKTNAIKRDFVSNISRKKLKEAKSTIKRGVTGLIKEKEHEKDQFERQQASESLNLKELLKQNTISNLLNNIGATSKSGSSKNQQTTESNLYLASKQNYEVNDENLNIQYNSQIILSIKDTERNEYRKLSTKLRISDKCIADLMNADEYNINCLFRILPLSQFTMQNKILSMIEEDNIPESIDVEFENFTSEVNSNSSNYNLSLEKYVKYEESFQLYQDSSKRYLAFYPRNVDDIERVYSYNFSGDECYYLGFSEYPGHNTHFNFETVSSYQSEIDGFVKRDHYVYLTTSDQSNKHYLHCKRKELSITETDKTPLTIKVIRSGVFQEEKRSISRSNVFLISYANDNFYLNAKYELVKHSREYV